MKPTISEQFYNATRLVVTPLAGYLLLDDNFGKSPRKAGDIYLPDASENKQRQPMGRVLKVGPGLESMYQVGDVIVYRRTKDFEFEAGGIKYRLLPGRPEEGAVLCKVELP